jgi:hypothetical protein
MDVNHSSLIARLHIITLFGFAVAQPLYDLLERNAEFFIARRSQPQDLFFLCVALSLLLPGHLVLAELLLCPRRFRAVVQLIFVAVLTALIAMQALMRIERLPARFLVPAAVLGGTVVAVGYWRLRLVRVFVTALSPAILIFPVLFLLHPAIAKIIRGDDAVEIVNPGPNATMPVVMVVFDEFPLTSLLDEERQIDAVHYPNFAALARQATWCRNATSVHYLTTSAVPAILTGKYPEDTAEGTTALPTCGDHPHNLFTFLGGSYQEEVFESMTRLCPDQLCDRRGEGMDARQRLTSLFADLSVVELHLLAPPQCRRRLPPITQSWKNFGDDSCSCCLTGKLRDDRPGQFAQFLDSIHDGPRPTLHFLHVLLPHSPFRFLPSGKRYCTDTGLEALSLHSVWPDEEEPVHQAYQRHLLQVCYVDGLLGRLIERLKAVGLYDRALLIVTADHGISFLPGQPYRLVTSANCADIMRVPLFIKKPGQDAAVVSDRNVQTIDILPSIADVLGASLPWPVNGRSVFDISGPDAPEKIIIGKEGRLVFGPDLGETRNTKHETRNTTRFGVRSSEFGLLGQTVGELNPLTESGVRVELDNAQLFDNVRPQDGFVPALIKGTVSSASRERKRPEEAEPVSLAVAVNGTVQAVTRSYGHEGGQGRWSVVIPETAFWSGRNNVDVYVVSRGPFDNGGRTWLARAGSSAGRISNPSHARGILSEGAVTGPDGQSLRVVPKALQGCLDRVERVDGCLEVAGWAADVKRGELPRSLLIFVNQKLLYSGRPNAHRPDVGQATGNAGLAAAGFNFALPLEWFNGSDNAEVRLFALSKQGEATELMYPAWYEQMGRRPIARLR